MINRENCFIQMNIRKILRILSKKKHWIDDAVTEYADFVIKKNNTIFWHEGIWHNGIWFDGTWSWGIWCNGTWKNGTWEKGLWKQGIWHNGIWYNGIWENGMWLKGTWKNGVWKTGLIRDSKKQGNFEPDWEWDKDYVRSPISPREYFRKK